jgi:hypothetical protein
MPRPRTPTSKARATGQNIKHPERFSKRSEPRKIGPLGSPPTWMNAGQVAAWKQFQAELGWLNHSHRALVEIACAVRARINAGEDVGVHALNLLRQCLGQMGATPADSSKISAPDEEGEEDPADKYFRN